MDELENKLVEAIKKLPQIELIDEQILGEAKSLILGISLMSFNDQASAKPSRKKQGPATELKKLQKLLIDVSNQISAMHIEAHSAVDAIPIKQGHFYRRPPLAVLPAELDEWQRAINLALVDMPNKPALTGSPPKVWPRLVAHLTLKRYERLTSRRATISVDEFGKAKGHYFEFLSSVFQALRITARPESQARTAISDRRNGIDPLVDGPIVQLKEKTSPAESG